jgi:hypothetical protein
MGYGYLAYGYLGGNPIFSALSRLDHLGTDEHRVASGNGAGEAGTHLARFAVLFSIDDDIE